MPTATCIKCHPHVDVSAKTKDELREKQREHDREFHSGFDLFGPDFQAGAYSLYGNKNRGYY